MSDDPAIIPPKFGRRNTVLDENLINKDSRSIVISEIKALSKKFEVQHTDYGLENHIIQSEISFPNKQGTHFASISNNKNMLISVHQFYRLIDTEKELSYLNSRSKYNQLVEQLKPKLESKKIDFNIITKEKALIEEPFKFNGLKIRTFIDIWDIEDISFKNILIRRRFKSEPFKENEIISILKNLKNFLEVAHANNFSLFNLELDNLYLHDGKLKLFNTQEVLIGDESNKVQEYSVKNSSFCNRLPEKHSSNSFFPKLADIYHLGILGLHLLSMESVKDTISKRNMIDKILYEKKDEFPVIANLLECLLKENPEERSFSAFNSIKLKEIPFNLINDAVDKEFKLIKNEDSIIDESLCNICIGRIDEVITQTPKLLSKVKRMARNKYDIDKAIEVAFFLVISKGGELAMNILKLLEEENIFELKDFKKFKIAYLNINALYYYRIEDYQNFLIWITKVVDIIDKSSYLHNDFHMYLHYSQMIAYYFEIGDTEGVYSKLNEFRNYYENNSSYYNEYLFIFFKFEIMMKCGKRISHYNEFKDAFKSCQKTFPTLYPDVIDSKMLLGLYALTLGENFEGFDLIEGAASDTYQFYGENRKIVEAIHNLALAYSACKLSKKANQLHNMSYEYALKYYGKEDPALINYLITLSEIHSNNLDFEKASKYLEFAYDHKLTKAKELPTLSSMINHKFKDRSQIDFEPTFGHDGELLIIMNNLALVYKAQNNESKYEDMLKLTYKLAFELKKYKGNSDYCIDTVFNTIVENVSIFFEERGQFDKGLNFLQSCEEVIKSGADNNINFAIVQICKANIYNRKGFVEKAIALLKESQELVKKVLVEKSEDIAIIYNNIACLYYQIGDYDQAKEYLVKCLEIRKSIHSKNHFDIGFTLNNLAIVQGTLKDYQSANANFHNSIEILKKADKLSDLRKLSKVQNNFGVNLLQLKEYEKASSVFYMSLRTKEKILEYVDADSIYPEIGIIWNNLGLLYAEQAENEKSLECFKKSLHCKRHLSPGHPSKNSSFYNYTLMLHKLGRTNEIHLLCEERLQEKHNMIKDSVEENIEQASFYLGISEMYQIIWDREKSREFCNKALEIYQNFFPIDDPRINICLNRLKELRFV